VSKLAEKVELNVNVSPRHCRTLRDGDRQQEVVELNSNVLVRDERKKSKKLELSV
jgi:hypothetical protein